LAGSTPEEAQDAFIGPLQRALSCVCSAQLIVGWAQAGEVQALTVSDDPIALRTTGDRTNRLRLSIQQQYRLVEDPDPTLGPWKVSTRAYRYQVSDCDGKELLAWHWHPSSREQRPHLHVSGGRFHGCHLPTSRVSIEGILRLLVAELHVRPRRDDWMEVLNSAEGGFIKYRTWA
jgi:hypothetical protein